MAISSAQRGTAAQVRSRRSAEACGTELKRSRAVITINTTSDLWKIYSVINSRVNYVAHHTVKGWLHTIKSVPSRDVRASETAPSRPCWETRRRFNTSIRHLPLECYAL